MTKTTLNTSRSLPSTPSNILPSSGPVAIRLTNDYLFRALLQENNLVLKSLISSLLSLQITDIRSAEIRNPILLGEHVNEKDFILDIRVLLNNNTIVNLEMQVINEKNWPERSLCYLCRSFHHLNKGEDYLAVKSAIQIGLLDFTLFPERPEFYATYYMMNEKNHHIYSRKLRLNVLDLTQIELATEEDKAHQLDYWAKFFKSKTWEEIAMLAQNQPEIREAANTIYQISQDEMIREQCEAREDYYRRQRTAQRFLEQLQKENSDQKAEIANQKSTIADKDAEIAVQKSAIADKDAEIAVQKSAIADKDAEIAALREQLSKFQKF